MSLIFQNYRCITGTYRAPVDTKQVANSVSTQDFVVFRYINNWPALFLGRRGGKSKEILAQEFGIKSKVSISVFGNKPISIIKVHNIDL